VRDLDWEGCLNARDLGGLLISGGGVTLFGSIVRSDNPSYLTAGGWQSVRDYGVRTVIALRTVGTTDDEPDEGLVPEEIKVRRVAIEDGTDEDFRRLCVETHRWCTPLYFKDMLEHWPQRCAKAVISVAEAPAGGVLICCGRGCDRTGLLAFLLLGLVGVKPEEIAADWWRSVERLRPRDPGYQKRLEEVLQNEHSTVGNAIEDALANLAPRLGDYRVTQAHLDALRSRLVGPVIPSGS
jgi:protein-tyrosine phosphatase